LGFATSLGEGTTAFDSSGVMKSGPVKQSGAALTPYATIVDLDEPFVKLAPLARNAYASLRPALHSALPS
jgi:hypothetical protein